MAGRARVYVILLAVFFTLALTIGGELPYTMFFLTLWIGIMCVGSLYLSYLRLSNSYSLSKYEARVGEENNLRLEIHNSSFFTVPFGLVVQNLPKRLTSVQRVENIASLEAQRSTCVWNKIVCQRRGRYHIHDTHVVVQDLLGIAKLKKNLKSGVDLIVYPRLIRIEKLGLPSNRQLGTAPSLNKSLEDFSSILDLRKYNYGDSLKKVHWKVTAKTGELFVKNYEFKANTGLWIFLDMQDLNYRNDEEGYTEECAIEASLAVAYFGLRNNMDVNLICYGENRISLEGNEVSKVDSFVKSMIDISPRANIHIGEILKTEGRFVPWGSTIVTVTPRVDSGLYSAYYSLSKLGYKGAVIQVGQEQYSDLPKGQMDKNCELLASDGIKVYKVKDSNHIQSALEG